MALFGSKTKDPTTSANVRPTVVKTQNVARELMNLANAYDIKVDTLDFNLLEVKTYTRIFDEKKEVEWEEISQEELKKLDLESALLNINFQIKQVYEVEMFTKGENDRYKDLRLAVGANATKCKVYLSIKEGSVLNYNPKIDHELYSLINKRKIRAGILINIFDDMLPGVVSKISASAKVQESVTYTKNENILVAQGHEPTPTTNDALILHYDTKKEVSENDRVDYAERGFIQSVLKDELLIEYVKPKLGKPGRNCRGEYIKPSEPDASHAPTFTIDDTIRMVDKPDSIEYYANENGYIALDGDRYTIKTDVEIGGINFKSTGSISTGLDSDVTINVKETDAASDAVGPGMVVEVSEINIAGNVGSTAKVSALKATIEGQTHSTSVVRADDLSINIHKGTAYGKNIKVTRLEQGTIDGDFANVTQAIGGNIRAKEIRIELCGNNVKATASRLIEIKKLQGSENVFTIDPLLKRDSKNGLSEHAEKIESLEKDIKELEKDIEKYTQLIKEGTNSFNDVKKRLTHYKKNGVEMPSSFVKQYKQFQKMQDHLKAVTSEHEQKSDQLSLLTTQTASFQDRITDARIINRGEWIGYNEIVFNLVDPPIKLSYTPHEGSPEKVFGIVELEDGGYEIRTVHE